MKQLNIVCISHNPSQLVTVSQEIMGMEATVGLYEDLEQVNSFINNDNTVVIIEIDKNFSFDFIEQNHDKMLWLGLVDEKNYVNLFDKLNSWQSPNLLTTPWQKGQLRSAIERMINLQTSAPRTDAEQTDAERQIQSLREELKVTKLAAERQHAELEQISNMLEENLKDAQSAKEEMIPIISALINLRIKKPLNDSINSAQLAVRIAKKTNIAEDQVKEIYTAALLHNIGQIALPDEILSKPYNQLSDKQKTEFDDLVLRGQAILNSIPMFEKIAQAIRNLYESYDGSGFPDQLSGENIPVYSRILLPAIDYYDMQKENYFNRVMSAPEAEAYIFEHQGKKYDPEIVKYLTSVLFELKSSEQRKIVRLELDHVTPGMELASAVRIRDDISLLTPGKILSQPVIDKLLLIQTDVKENLTLNIYETSQ